jgi:magnesium chelatase family protein
MTREESLEVTQIYSVMGMLRKDEPLVTERPFRSPHHTISSAGLAGGGTSPRPGEISLAHKGVLFLDELPEFRKDTLEVLRQPLEDSEVTISRVNGSVTYPSEFMLVCAMNPCKCGWYGHPSGRCTCSQQAVDQYLGRISGPLLDRIDIIVEVPSVEFEELSNREPAEPSSAIRERVNAARQIQQARGVQCNAALDSAGLRDYCQLDDAATVLMKRAFDRLNLSARSYDRVLKVARTIADLEGAEKISAQHIAESIQYRSTKIGRN